VDTIGGKAVGMSLQKFMLW